MKKLIVKTSLITVISAFALTGFARENAASKPASDNLAAELFGSYEKAMQGFSASVSLGYESEYIFRGKANAGHSFQPSVNLGYDMGHGFSAYGGFWNNTSLMKGQSASNEIDLSGGVKYSLDAFTFDAGYTYYWYPSSDSPSTNEMKFGVSYDTSALLGDFNVTPSLYYYYDWDLHNNTVEASLSYYAPVSKWLFEKDLFGINASVCYGYVGASKNSYGYVSVISNLVLKLTDSASLSAGVRYAYHNDDDSSSDASNNRVWFGSAISFGF